MEIGQARVRATMLNELMTWIWKGTAHIENGHELLLHTTVSYQVFIFISAAPISSTTRPSHLLPVPLPNLSTNTKPWPTQPTPSSQGQPTWSSLALNQLFLYYMSPICHWSRDFLANETFPSKEDFSSTSTTTTPSVLSKDWTGLLSEQSPQVRYYSVLFSTPFLTTIPKPSHSIYSYPPPHHTQCHPQSQRPQSTSSLRVQQGPVKWNRLTENSGRATHSPILLHVLLHTL